jgi:hypothetical protein
MSLRLGLTAAIVVVALVGVLAFNLVGGGSPGPGTTAAPTQPGSAAPSARTAAPTRAPFATVSLDTTTWGPFTSSYYFYTIKYPAGWEATPASRAWTMATDRTDWLSPAQDRFIEPGVANQIGIHGFMIKLAADQSFDQWIEAYLASPNCHTSLANMRDIVMDGQPGKLADQPECDDAIAFVESFERGFVYVFTIGRSGQQPLFDAFLSTFRFT